MIEEEVLKSFIGRNVVVIGGTGLIGRQVVDILCGFGAKVKIVWDMVIENGCIFFTV